MKRTLTLTVALLCAVPMLALAAKSEHSPDAYNHYLKALLLENQGNLSGAADELDEALNLSPDSAFLQRSYAEAELRLGQFQKAADAIEKAIASDPEDPKAYILAGQIYWSLGDAEKSEARLSKAVQLAPDEAEAYINLAVAVTPKDPKRAIKLYQDFLDRHPDDVDIEERLAQLYYSLGDVKQAKSSWDKVLEISPDSLRAHLASAQIAEVEHDTATAISHYEAVLQQDPTNLPLLLRIGELRYRNDEMSKAYEAFSKAQSIAPNSSSANFWMALLAEHQGNWEEAIRLLKQVATKNAEPGVMLRLSYYYSQAGKQKEAIDILKKLSDSEPENTDFLNYLALAYEQDRQLGNAEKTLKKLIDIDAKNPEPLFHLATIYDRMKRFNDVEATLKKAIDIDPNFHMALNYLAYSYAERGIKLDEAEKLLNTAIALDPDNAAYLDSMGWTLYKEKKFKKSEDFLITATKKGSDPLIWEHLGDAYAGDGDWVSAINAWDAALRLNPKQKSAEDKLRAAMQKIPTEKRVAIAIQRSLTDFTHLKALQGLCTVSACENKHCMNSKAQFSYDVDKGLRLEIPGPLATPFLLVTKDKGLPVKFGAVHPTFQAHEKDVIAAFGKIDDLLRGAPIGQLNEKEISSTAAEKRGQYTATSGSLTFTVNGKSWNLDRIDFKSPSTDETLALSKYEQKSLDLPTLMEWNNNATKFGIKIQFANPVIAPIAIARPESESEDEEK